jgi:hypothetical protein
MSEKLLLPGSDGWADLQVLIDEPVTDEWDRLVRETSLASRNTIEHLAKRLRARGPCAASIGTVCILERHEGDHVNKWGASWTDAESDPVATEANEKRIMKELLGDDDG